MNLLMIFVVTGELLLVIMRMGDIYLPGGFIILRLLRKGRVCLAKAFDFKWPKTNVHMPLILNSFPPPHSLIMVGYSDSGDECSGKIKLLILANSNLWWAPYHWLVYCAVTKLTASCFKPACINLLVLYNIINFKNNLSFQSKRINAFFWKLEHHPGLFL